MRLRLKLFVGSALLVATGTVLAHHSTQVFYDYDDDLEIEGTVTWVFWKNPHVRFNLVRQDDAGREEIWELEAGSVNTLERVGIGVDTLKVGEVVRVAGPPSRHGLNTIYVSNVLFGNGREVSLQANQRLRWTDASVSRPAQPAESVQESTRPELDGIFRVWSRRYDADSETLPYSASARQASETWNPLTEDPGLRCIPPGMPSAMDNPYPIEFAKQGDDIIMRLEEWDGIRTIHMQPDADAANPSGTPMGYSTGRWEESTFVVTTTNVDYPYFDSRGTPQGELVRIVERFTLGEDESRLEYQVTVDDRDTFTALAEMSHYYVWNPAEEIKRYECTLAE
jgi:hypothetical protein